MPLGPGKNAIIVKFLEKALPEALGLVLIVVNEPQPGMEGVSVQVESMGTDPRFYEGAPGILRKTATNMEREYAALSARHPGAPDLSRAYKKEVDEGTQIPPVGVARVLASDLVGFVRLSDGRGFPLEQFGSTEELSQFLRAFGATEIQWDPVFDGVTLGLERGLYSLDVFFKRIQLPLKASSHA